MSHKLRIETNESERIPDHRKMSQVVNNQVIAIKDNGKYESKIRR